MQGGTAVSVVRMLIVTALSVLALGVLAGPASAGIWTPVESNTTEDITAIEYQGPDRFWFTTGGGKIFRRVGGVFQQEQADLTTVFRDIEFQPGGSRGLAVGTNGKVWRSFGSKMDEVIGWFGNTPIAIGEYGCREDPENPGLATEWLRDAAAYARTHNIVSMSYYNSDVNSPEGSWELQGETEQAFAEMLASEWVARPR